MSQSRSVRFLLTCGLFAAAWTAVSAVGDACGQGFSRRGRRWATPRAAAEAPSPTQGQDHPLYAFVRDQQHRFVRPSFNEQDCFTWVDLGSLRERLASGEVAQLIQADADFGGVCDAVKRNSPAERDGLFNAALRIYRPTWAQLGRIDPAGQTDAGQQADILIGQTVVGLVRARVAESAQPETPSGAKLEVGARVRAAFHRTPIQVGNDVVATIDAGEELGVIAVDGPWAGVAVIQDGRQVLGWIHHRYLVIQEIRVLHLDR
jgi:hypothetical protein